MAKNNRNHTFKYVKSPTFETLIANGIVGGINPRGLLSMNFYIDAIDLPKTNKYEVKENGQLGQEIAQNQQSLETASIRELISGVTVDLPTAKSLVQWILKHINEFEVKTGVPADINPTVETFNNTTNGNSNG